jgi:hypothetical protein
MFCVERSEEYIRHRYKALKFPAQSILSSFLYDFLQAIIELILKSINNRYKFDDLSRQIIGSF